MSHTLNLLFALAGTAAAALSLASGEALRSDDEPLARRVTPRLLLALILLSIAAGGDVTELLQSGGSPAPLTWVVPLLLAAGAGAAL